MIKIVNILKTGIDVSGADASDELELLYLIDGIMRTKGFRGIISSSLNYKEFTI